MVRRIRRAGIYSSTESERTWNEAREEARGVGMSTKISQPVGARDIEHFVVFIVSHYKRVKVHGEYGSTGAPSGTLLGWNKCRVFAIPDINHSFLVLTRTSTVWTTSVRVRLFPSMGTDIPESLPNQ